MSTASTPKYRVVEQQLRARISGLDDGALLPTEAELCKEYSVRASRCGGPWRKSRATGS